MRTDTLFGPPTCGGFVSTKGHRRFESFCDDVARYRCIGACVGPAGVGKTASARRYTLWDVIEPRYPTFSHTEKPPPEVASAKIVHNHRTRRAGRREPAGRPPSTPGSMAIRRSPPPRPSPTPSNRNVREAFATICYANEKGSNTAG